jgi:hypothetical protein
MVTLVAGVDTYAAVSVCGLEQAHRCNWEVKHTAVELQSVDGTPLNICGETAITVKRPGTGEWVKIPVIVVKKLCLENIDILIGATAHSKLGRGMRIDLSSNQAEYVGVVVEKGVKADECGNLQNSGVNLKLKNFHTHGKSGEDREKTGDEVPKAEQGELFEVEFKPNVELINLAKHVERVRTDKQLTLGEKSSMKGHKWSMSTEIIQKDFTVRFDGTRWVLRWNWVRGEPLRWDEFPRLPTVYKYNWVTQAHKDHAFRELQQMLDTGFLSYVGEVSAIPHRKWLPIRLVNQPHKETTPIRIAVDLTKLNEFVCYCDEASKYEKVFETVLLWRRIGAGYAVDLSKAFMQVGIDPSQQEYLTIRVGDSLYSFTRMPFGLSISPRVLYEILQVILQGLKVSYFRDDLFSSSHDELSMALRRLNDNGFVAKKIERVGVGMNPVKLLGLTIQSTGETIEWIRTEKYPGSHTVPSGPVSYRELLGFLAELLPGGLIPVAGWLRPVVAQLRSIIAKEVNIRGNWDAIVDEKVTQLANNLEGLWQLRGNPMRGTWKIPPCDELVRLFVDASQEYTAFVIQNKEGGTLADNCKPADKHQINTLELDAFIFGLHACIEYGFKEIEIFTDSQTVHGWVQALLEDRKCKLSGLYSKLEIKRLGIISELKDLYGLRLWARWTKGIYNPADVLTRVEKLSKSCGAIQANPLNQMLLERSYPKTKSVLHRTKNVREIVYNLHGEMLHPSARVLMEVLKAIGVEAKEKEIQTMINRCKQCRLKTLKQNVWKSTGSSFEKGAGECFIDTFKLSKLTLTTMVDADSRFAMVNRVEGNVDGKQTVAAIANWLAYFPGTIEIIRSDNGPEFNNIVVQNFLEEKQIKHHKSTVYHPQSNGVIERFHRTLLKLIRVQDNERSTEQRVLDAVRVYHSTPHKSLGYKSPIVVWYKKLTGEIDGVIREEEARLVEEDDVESVIEEEEANLYDEDEVVQRNVQRNAENPQMTVENSVPAQEDVVESENVEGTTERYAVGQSVWYLDTSIRKKECIPWSEGRIEEILGRGAYLVKFENGRQRKVNSEKLRLQPEDLTDWSEEVCDNRELRRSSRNRRAPRKFTPDAVEQS